MSLSGYYLYLLRKWWRCVVKKRREKNYRAFKRKERSESEFPCLTDPYRPGKFPGWPSVWVCKVAFGWRKEARCFFSSAEIVADTWSSSISSCVTLNRWLRFHSSVSSSLKWESYWHLPHATAVSQVALVVKNRTKKVIINCAAVTNLDAWSTRSNLDLPPTVACTHECWLPGQATSEIQAWSLGGKASPGEGDSSPFQCSCLGNPMERGAWQVMVHGVAKALIQLSNLTARTPPPPPTGGVL